MTRKLLCKPRKNLIHVAVQNSSKISLGQKITFWLKRMGERSERRKREAEDGEAGTMCSSCLSKFCPTTELTQSGQVILVSDSKGAITIRRSWNVD